MRWFSVIAGALHGFSWVTLLLLTAFCHGNDKSIEVVGVGECVDCVKNNVESSHVLKRIQVAIDCKAADGSVKTRGFGKLDEGGKFKVTLPPEMLHGGHLKEECFVKLHGASLSTSCPLQNGAVELSKIVNKFEDNEKHTFETAAKLSFSATCTAAFLRKPFYKPLPNFQIPPLKNFPPIYKKPMPFPPIYKKPFPFPPIYKKPLPFPPIYKKKPLPFPPIYRKPPINKKELHKFHPVPKIPIKHFHHP